MKKIKQYSAIVILIFLHSCSPKELLQNIDGTNQIQPTNLPPITTIGNNTFGCLVNNELFLPRKIISFSAQSSGEPIIAFYNWSRNFTTNIDTYTLNINISNQFTHKSIEINFESNDLLIEGHTYNFGQNVFGSFNASYYSLFNFGYGTSNQSMGKITILKFDRANRIISGTFWFNAFDTYNNSGSIVEIREGRFDLQYYE